MRRSVSHKGVHTTIIFFILCLWTGTQTMLRVLELGHNQWHLYKIMGEIIHHLRVYLRKLMLERGFN